MVKKASTKNKGYDHKTFIKAVKKGNCLFDNDQHQDSHEYLSWFLDQVHEKYINSERERLKKEQPTAGE